MKFNNAEEGEEDMRIDMKKISIKARKMARRDVLMEMGNGLRTRVIKDKRRDDSRRACRNRDFDSE